MADPGSWAVTLPDQTAKNSQMMQMLWQHNYQQQRMAGLQQNRELARQAKSAQFVDANLKDANYATGTAADPLINNMTAAARQKYADLIHKNPNMDEGDLEMQMQADIGKISQYSAAIKAGRKQIEDGVQHYKDQPGIDVDALRNGAMTNFLNQGGNKLVDDPAKIDLNKNYLDSELQAHPDHYVIGDQPLLSSLDKLKPTISKDGDTVISEHAGVTTKNKYTDSLYPFQSLVTDTKGNATGVRVNSIPATLTNGQNVPDPEDPSKTMQIVDDKTMRMVMSPGVAAQLKRDTDDYIRKNGMKPEDYSPGSEAYNLIGKHIMYQLLNTHAPKDLVKEKDRTQDSILNKMQLGMVDALGRTISKSEERKEQELLGSKNGKIRLAANMDPRMIDAGKPYTDPSSGRQFIDVTDAIGGFETLNDKKGTEYTDPVHQVAKVMVDPSNPGAIYTQEGGNIVEYKGKAIDALLTRHGAANGYKSQKEVDIINDKIPIKPDLQAGRAARAAMEYKRRQQQAALNNQLLPGVQ